MANQALAAGSTLRGGKYKIEKILGQGSFGITYLASAKISSQGNLGTMEVEVKVAIKEFFMSEVNGRQADGSSVDGSSGSVFTNYRRKFRKEAENLAALKHSNIVRVFDVFDENNTTYYAMEYIDGSNLDDYIRERGSIPEHEALNIIAEIGGAVTYMHSRKMLHLDIKPKNIMRKAGGTGCLIDFGLSKQFTDDGEPESSTSIGLGTPGYAPLEQAGYSRDGSFPATLDVYALGATLFKMLTGKRPPEATYILNDGFPSAMLADKGISAATCAAVKKAMAPLRKDRFQDIMSFIDALGCSHCDFTPDDDDEATVVGSPSSGSSSASESQGYTAHQSEADQPDEPELELPEWEPETPWWRKKWALIAAAVAAIVVVVFMLIPRGTPVAKPIDTVTDFAWDSPLGPAVYFGDLNVQYNCPDGRGIAKITGGEYAGSVYEGNFVNGNMDGQATYTQDNGDTFVGTFKNNQYQQGRYTIKATGEYFDGTFENGQPAAGDWYDKDGKKL